MGKFSTFNYFFALAFALLIGSQGARATLGEALSSVDRDGLAIGAKKHISSAHSRYSIEEISNDGIIIREFVSNSGTVFAIAWKNGNAQPDLSPLLGSYLSEVQAAAQKIPKVRGRRAGLTIQTPHIVVRKFGHMRDARGMAYAPALFPNGVSLDEIQ